MGLFRKQAGGTGNWAPASRAKPRPGQESVWDYPRPPRLEPSKRLVRVYFADTEIAFSNRALRVLETAGPPTYYVPAEDVATGLLVQAEGHTACEWKGLAAYSDIVVGERRAARAAWSYPHPNHDYAILAGYFSFYPGRVDNCYLDDELVTAQPGDFYGGWITKDIVGPFKGDPSVPKNA
ncbi:MAG: DUF427 domain-containing protein [Actinomycetota bacterium]